MPVDYTIAARNALSNTAPDFANMLAQYQMMGARATQQQLAQQQLEEYERARQEEENLRNYLGSGGVNMMDPQLATRMGAISPKYLTQIMTAQAQAKRDAELAAEARARISQGERRLGAEMPGLLAGASKAQIESSNAALTRLRDVAGTVLQNNGEGFDELKKLSEHTDWGKLIGDKYDPKRVRSLATTATTIQEYLKPHLQTVKDEIEQVQPGIGGAAPVVRPAVVVPPDMGNVPATPVTAPPEGKLTPRASMGAPEAIPAERQPLTQREYKELPMRQQSTQIFSDILNNYEKLKKHGSMASEKQNMPTLVRNVAAGTPAGQEIARITDPVGQKYRDVIDKQIDQYIQTRRALGITSAQEANTIDELVRLKSMLGSPKFSIEAVREILANADKYAGTGTLKVPEPEEQTKGVIDGRTLLTGPRQKELRSILHGE